MSNRRKTFAIYVTFVVKSLYEKISDNKAKNFTGG